VFAACSGGDPQAGAGGAGGRGAFPAMGVKTITLEPKPIPQTSEFVATVKSLRSTNIQPQVEGIVRQILVKAGDRVRAGQPLVQIDPEKQQATVATTQSQRASREADLASRSSSSRETRSSSTPAQSARPSSSRQKRT
jgi:multidrug efflux pump subunit AcrA (membrane-fusion protein)